MEQYPFNHVSPEKKEERISFQTVYASPMMTPPPVPRCFCTNCGFELRVHDNFCGKCGTPTNRQKNKTYCAEVYASPKMF